MVRIRNFKLNNSSKNLAQTNDQESDLGIRVTNINNFNDQA